MKFEIFSEMKKEEKTIKLQLRSNEDGGVFVVAVDDNGDIEGAGHLLEFKKDGTIQRYSSVNDGFGFKLDEENRIKEYEN